jgi:hypothetical protein
MSLLRSIEKSYVYTFYVLVQFFTDEWRAALVMGVFQGILIEGLVCSVALGTGHTPLSITRPVVIIGGLVIYAITHYVLVRKHRWQRYEPEFKRYSKAKRTMASTAVWGGFALTSLVGIALIKEAIH